MTSIPTSFTICGFLCRLFSDAAVNTTPLTVAEAGEVIRRDYATRVAFKDGVKARYGVIVANCKRRPGRSFLSWPWSSQRVPAPS